MEKQSLVSIGIPTYNRKESLVRSVESAINQDYKCLEVIVVDNASIDGTEQIMQDYLERDSRIQYVRSEYNQGPILNFIKARDLSQGEYFMWLADDDYLEYNYVRACLQELSKNANLAVVGGRAKFFGRDNQITRNGKLYDLSSPHVLHRLYQFYRAPADNSIFYGLMRAKLAKINRFNHSIIGDWLFTAGMASQGQVKTIENTCINRQIGGSSKSHDELSRILGIPRWHFVFLGTVAGIHAAKDVFDNPAYAEQKYMEKISQSFTVLFVNMYQSGIKRVVVKWLQTIFGTRWYNKTRSLLRNL